MTAEQLKQAAALDISYWYAYYDHCPHCGLDLRNLNPYYNLFPHFMGACVPAILRGEAKQFLQGWLK